MGGFGVYQLASQAPEMFAGAGVIAGYGIGTLDPENVGNFAPQPISRNIFQNFLNRCAPGLARIPALVVIHAESDKVSSFTDASAIVNRVRTEGGNVQFITVPDDIAESDRHSKKSHSTFHRYYNYALTGCTSNEILYNFMGATDCTTK